MAKGETESWFYVSSYWLYWNLQKGFNLQQGCLLSSYHLSGFSLKKPLSQTMHWSLVGIFKLRFIFCVNSAMKLASCIQLMEIMLVSSFLAPIMEIFEKTLEMLNWSLVGRNHFEPGGNAGIFYCIFQYVPILTIICLLLMEVLKSCTDCWYVYFNFYFCPFYEATFLSL